MDAFVYDSKGIFLFEFIIINKEIKHSKISLTAAKASVMHVHFFFMNLHDMDTSA